MWGKQSYSQFLRSMAAWGGNPKTLTYQEILIMKTNPSNTPIIWIALGVIALATILGISSRGKRMAETERDAYAKVSEECGVIRVSPSDGKRYVSFAFRSQRYPAYHQEETPEFLAALESLKYIKDLRGVHIDGLPVTVESLKRLSAIETLERVTARDSYITENDVANWKSRPAQSGKPPVEVWLIYDAEHP
jgi:hypothetical protein